jgi:hypothetical protein
MPRWALRGYGNGRRALFEEEYQAQTAMTRAEFRATWNGLRGQVRESWTRPAGFDMLSGKYGELGKLRFKASNAQHRPLGFFGPGPNEFTFVAWATERDSKFDPPGIRDTALARMLAIKEGRAEAYEFDFKDVRN